jgi:hypothetical protein
MVFVSVSFALLVIGHVCNRFSRFIWKAGAIRYYNISLRGFPIYRKFPISVFAMYCEIKQLKD